LGEIWFVSRAELIGTQLAKYLKYILNKALCLICKQSLCIICVLSM